MDATPFDIAVGSQVSSRASPVPRSATRYVFLCTDGARVVREPGIRWLVDRPARSPVGAGSGWSLTSSLPGGSRHATPANQPTGASPSPEMDRQWTRPRHARRSTVTIRSLRWRRDGRTSRRHSCGNRLSRGAGADPRMSHAVVSGGGRRKPSRPGGRPSALRPLPTRSHTARPGSAARP